MRRARSAAVFVLAGLAAGLMMAFAGLLAGQDLTKPIVYSVPGMDRADVRPDLVYRKDGAAEMKMDIYLPPGLGPDERRPAVLFIHGGPVGPNPPLKAKDWGVYRSYGRLMAASGFIGVTFNHRYAGMTAKDLETSFSDVEEAIRYVRANAAAHHVDPERIALWAFSGGGPHLSIALRGQTPFVRAVISFYAILDLGSYSAVVKETPETLAKFSPLAFLAPPPGYLPPFLIGRAGRDAPVINRAVEAFISRMLALNADINLLSHPEGRHGFDLLDDDDRTRSVIAAAVAFLKSRLDRPAR